MSLISAQDGDERLFFDSVESFAAFNRLSAVPKEISLAVDDSGRRAYGWKLSTVERDSLAKGSVIVSCQII